MTETVNTTPAQPEINQAAASEATQNTTPTQEPQIDLEKFMVPVKVNGQEIKKTLKEVIKGYQIEQAGYKKLEEAARKEKEVQSIYQLLKEKPDEALAKLGIDPDEWAEKRLYSKIQLAQMSPEQRKAAELEQQVKDYEKKMQEIEAEKQRQTIEQETAKYRKTIEQELKPVLEKMDLPKTPYMVAEIAKVKRAWFDKGVDLPWESCAEVAKGRVNFSLQKILETMSEEQIIKTFSEVALNKLRRADLSRLKAKIVPSEPVGKGITKAAPKKEAVKQNLEEYMESRRKAILGS